jgi:hypothetical protein
MVGMVTIGLVGLTIAAGMTRLERSLMPWMVRGTEGAR